MVELVGQIEDESEEPTFRDYTHSLYEILYMFDYVYYLSLQPQRRLSYSKSTRPKLTIETNYRPHIETITESVEAHLEE